MIGTDLLIQVEANHYVVRLNGIGLLDFTDPSPLSLMDTSRFNSIPEASAT
jgi:hypothetical protein